MKIRPKLRVGYAWPLPRRHLGSFSSSLQGRIIAFAPPQAPRQTSWSKSC
jgi:hypothetical protein